MWKFTPHRGQVLNNQIGKKITCSFGTAILTVHCTVGIIIIGQGWSGFFSIVPIVYRELYSWKATATPKQDCTIIISNATIDDRTYLRYAILQTVKLMT